MRYFQRLVTLLVTSTIIFTASCKNPAETVAVVKDPSGLPDSVLDSPITIGKEMTRADLEQFRKGSSFYQTELSKVPSKTTKEWMKLIDTLHPGMLIEQVEKVLPRNSKGGSHLWAYDGMRSEDLRQTRMALT